MFTEDEQAVIDLTQKTIDSILEQDWTAYCSGVKDQFGTIEFDSCNNYFETMDVHDFYFKIGYLEGVEWSNTLNNPVVRFYGDICLICYKRKVTLKRGETVKISDTTESRIFKKEGNKWIMVSLHRSIA